MELIRETLRTLFYKAESERIIESALNCLCKKQNAYSIERNLFSSAFGNSDLYYTLDQRYNISSLLENKWMRKDNDSDTLCFAEGLSVYNILLHFSSKTLFEKNDNPICDYDSILRWHEITSVLDEDLFTTSYLASKDISLGRQRHVFDWDVYLPTNNNELNAIFEKPMADIHNHLWGSTDIFIISWMRLMKNVSGHEKAFKNIENFLDPKSIYSYDSKYCSLYIDAIKAAAIRQFLSSPVYIFKRNKDIIPILKSILKSNSLTEIIGFFNSFYSPYLSMSICGETESQSYKEERRFLYNTFKNIYSSKIDEFSANIFYAYLIIKYRFKHELVQLNNQPGFANFSEYQDRKDYFINDGKEPINMLADLFFSDSDNRFLETRIGPKNSLDKTRQNIQIIESNFKNSTKSNNKNVSYVVHFIKKEDETLKNKFSSLLQCRHYKQRNKIKIQTEVLEKWKSGSRISSKIVGIDAASSEIACRPEVFSQAYRYLRETRNSSILVDHNVKSLGFTYHVGEDFLGIVDGLRAIDEVLKFMNFRQGDRFGHALVLGVDVKDYYEKRHHRIALPKQVLLDNVTWLLTVGRQSEHFNKIQYSLRSAFEDLSRYIFLNEKDKYSADDFYDSWLLRGDDPQCYRTQNGDIKYIPDNISYWGIRGQNNNGLVRSARKNSLARELYYRYHYDANVKEKGEDMEIFEITSDYINLVNDLQKFMLREIEKRKIAIETNPTSNLRIGSLGKYSNHPILKYYNLGLELWNDMERHAIPVSINTDDRGVFCTTLEREFTLMAAALEKDFQNGIHNNPPKVIYKWLDDIREQALKQKF